MKLAVGLVNVLTVVNSIDLQANPLGLGMLHPVCGEHRAED